MFLSDSYRTVQLSKGSRLRAALNHFYSIFSIACVAKSYKLGLCKPMVSLYFQICFQWDILCVPPAYMVSVVGSNSSADDPTLQLPGSRLSFTEDSVWAIDNTKLPGRSLDTLAPLVIKTWKQILSSCESPGLTWGSPIKTVGWRTRNHGIPELVGNWSHKSTDLNLHKTVYWEPMK